jgi:nucleoside-diphosphate-sugar epimerase
MKIFLAGATGAVGKSLVPLLVGRGHRVFATTRKPGRAASLRSAGAEPVVVDGLDRKGLLEAVVSARPDVVVHEMTGLAGMTSLRNIDETLALTNRLRTEGRNPCWPPPAQRGRGGSWRRVSPAGPTRGRAAG